METESENPQLLLELRTRHRETAQRLSHVAAWKGLWHLAFQWTCILALLAIVVLCPRWWVVVLSWPLLASRMHALLVLLHDASHLRIFPVRWINDLASDWLLAFPLAMSTTRYRKQHLEHHAHAGSDADPDWQVQREDPDFIWPKSAHEARWVLIREFLGLNVLKTLRMLRCWSPLPKLFVPAPDFRWPQKLSFLVYNLGGVWLLWQTGLWWLVPSVWIPSQMTFLSGFIRIRALAEHLAIPGDSLHRTQNVVPNWWERICISPLNVNYHLDHHLFPSVPHYALPALHRELLKDPVYRHHTQHTRHYVTGPESAMRLLTRAGSRLAGEAS